VTKTVLGGVATKVKVKLSRKSRARLRRGLRRRRTVRVTLKIVAVDTAGNRRTAKKKVLITR
jgi:hypothetical protein